MNRFAVYVLMILWVVLGLSGSEQASPHLCCADHAVATLSYISDQTSPLQQASDLTAPIPTLGAHATKCKTLSKEDLKLKKSGKELLGGSRCDRFVFGSVSAGELASRSIFSEVSWALAYLCRLNI